MMWINSRFFIPLDKHKHLHKQKDKVISSATTTLTVRPGATEGF